MRKIAAFIAAMVSALAVAAPADAARPIMGYEFPDLCRNLVGTQTIMEVRLGKVIVVRPGTCRRVPRGF